MRIPALLCFTATLWAATPYGDATIRRDTFGIPHITAKTETAASFAFGFAQAEDHAIEIARRWVAARGEAHQAYGGSIDADFRIHQFHNREVSAKLWATLPTLYKSLIEAYVAGVNLYLSKNRSKLPAWIPTDFNGADILANTRSGGLAGINTIANAAATATPEGDTDGSNAFALHGSRTKSGSPILVGNPHLSWNSLYWEAQVTVPGKIDFYGSTLPGIPVLRAGFNEHLGWVNTNNSPDLVDVFYFSEDPNDKSHYLYAGKSRPLVQHKVTIGSETRTFEETHLGPVVRRDAGKIYVVKSAGLDAVRYYEGFYRLARTRSLAAFQKVMAMNLVPFSHFTYADAAGNIYYAWNARLPRRLQDGTDYTKPVPAEPKYIWTKFHRFTDYPQMRNPAGGYIANSNDPPWFTNLRQPLDAAKFPSYFERGELRLRQQAILDRINDDRKHDLDSAMEMKFDTRVLLAERIKADLVRTLQAAGEAETARVLDAWDNHVARDSKGAVLFVAFYQQYTRKTKTPFAVKWDAANPASTPRGLGDPAAAVEAMRLAAAATLQKYGRLDIAWGEANRFRFDGVDIAGDGASGTYGVYKVQTFTNDPKDGRSAAGWIGKEKPLVGFGDAWVLAVEFTKPGPRAMSVLAYGQTADPGSKHCCDQIEYFANHKLRPVWFTEAEVKAHTEREYAPE